MSKDYTFAMELSSVSNRIQFLLELKNASQDVGIFMLQNITPGQMKQLSKMKVFDEAGSIF